MLAVVDPATIWADNPESEIIAEGIDEIPVFWASLFVPHARRVDAYEGEDAGGIVGPVLVPNYCVDAAIARRRLTDLCEPIGRLLDQRSREVWSAFVGHLSSTEAAYFRTDAAEVWGLEPDGYDRYWETLLRLFVQPTIENLEAALKANELSFAGGSVGWAYEEETICKLAGAHHIREVPWLDT